jgi:glycosyltransferase involved in cell wall biosynthesis
VLLLSATVIFLVLRVVVHTLGHAAFERLRNLFRLASRRENRLRVGVDIRPFYEPLTGVGWYLYHLIHEIAKDDRVELLLLGDARMTDKGPFLHAALPKNARLCVFDLRGQPPSRLARPLTAAAYVAWMWLLDCDVFFGANYFLPRLMGAVARRRVITIHDLTYKRFPDLLQKETLDNLEAQMTREVARADAIICVSDATRRDLLAFYELDPGRAVTIHSGLGNLPDPAPAPDLPSRYILFVSTVEPRKNLTVLLDAFAELRRSGAYDGALVVAGKIGWKAEGIARRLSEPGVMHLDYVKPEVLATLYRRADLFVFPSLYEGFGFPMLEAMANGVPVVAARSSSLPEIGGDAAVYFEPSDASQLAAAIRRITGDGAVRADLVDRGRARGAQFRWDAAARATVRVLRAVSGR